MAKPVQYCEVISLQLKLKKKKESACSAGATGDTNSTLGLGRSPEGGHGNLPQYSCLENPMDRGVWWAAVHGLQRVRHDLATKPQQQKGS